MSYIGVAHNVNDRPLPFKILNILIILLLLLLKIRHSLEQSSATSKDKFLKLSLNCAIITSHS